jgi:hypothetical protein
VSAASPQHLARALDRDLMPDHPARLRRQHLKQMSDVGRVERRQPPPQLALVLALDQ